MAEAFVIEERNGVALATVMARKGVAAATIADALGVAVPDGPYWKRSGSLVVIGTGPGTWLAMAERDNPEHAGMLQGQLGARASVSDQSSAYVVLRIRGAKARALLQRGASIDLDPSVFVLGSVATTVVSHIGVIFWQIDEGPTYEIALFRSFAASFRHWLDTTSAAL